MVFKAMPIDSQDAAMLLNELNERLVSIIGNNGTAHVNPADFSGERAAFLIGYENDLPLCCAGIREMDRHTGEIKRVYARPNQIGAGAQLMREAERWAAAHGYSRLVLECRTGNPHAIAFYGRNGYAVCENYPPYVGVGNAVCMEKRIGLPVV